MHIDTSTITHRARELSASITTCSFGLRFRITRGGLGKNRRLIPVQFRSLMKGDLKILIGILIGRSRVARPAPYGTPAKCTVIAGNRTGLCGEHHALDCLLNFIEFHKRCQKRISKTGTFCNCSRRKKIAPLFARV